MFDSSQTSPLRNAFYCLSDIGMTSPHVTPQVKGHLRRSICLPTLTYGLECLSISPSQLAKLESFQATMVKRSLNIGKRSHNTALLAAMDIPKVADVLSQKQITLFHNSCKVPGPAKNVNCELLASYVISGQCEPGTLLQRVIQTGMSPTNVLMNKIRLPKIFPEDGVIDSIKQMLHHCNYTKPQSNKKHLVRLLTRCF